jgi:hypothetical protein
MSKKTLADVLFGWTLATLFWWAVFALVFEAIK